MLDTAQGLGVVAGRPAGPPQPGAFLWTGGGLQGKARHVCLPGCLLPSAVTSDSHFTVKVTETQGLSGFYAFEIAECMAGASLQGEVMSEPPRPQPTSCEGLHTRPGALV